MPVIVLATAGAPTSISHGLDTPPPDAEVGLDTPAYRVVLVDAPQEGKQPMRHELAIGGARDGQPHDQGICRSLIGNAGRDPRQSVAGRIAAG